MSFAALSISIGTCKASIAGSLEVGLEWDPQARELPLSSVFAYLKRMDDEECVGGHSSSYVRLIVAGGVGVRLSRCDSVGGVARATPAQTRRAAALPTSVEETLSRGEDDSLGWGLSFRRGRTFQSEAESQ